MCLWNKSINMVLKLSFEKHDAFYLKVVLFSHILHFSKWGNRHKEKNESKCFRDGENPNITDFSSLLHTLASTLFPYVSRQCCWLNVFSWKEKLVSPIIFSVNSWWPFWDYIILSLARQSLCPVLWAFGHYKGQIEAFGFSSLHPLNFSRIAYCLKDVSVSSDTDNKEHRLETSGILSAFDGLAFRRSQLLY